MAREAAPRWPTVSRVTPHPDPATPDDVERAAERIAPFVRRTPVIEHDGVLLKLELLQHAGSFKPRGAANRVLRARDAGELPEVGVVTASGGNHGAALAYVAGRLGVPAEVFVPSTSPALKQENIARFGAAVTVVQGYYDDAWAVAQRRVAQTGALFVPAFDHPDTVAGQGTMARELEQQLRETGGGLDTMLVAAGGGGFLGGQAAWLQDRVKLVAVEPMSTSCVHAARAAGAPVDVPVGGLAADSLGSKRVGEAPWAVLRDHLDEAVLVTDDDIRAAQRALWRDLRLVVEPGGAAAYAALLSGVYRPERGERVVVAVCGSNCDPSTVTG